MDGDRDGDTHWSTGLSSQSPNETSEGWRTWARKSGLQGMHPSTDDLMGAHQGQLDWDWMSMWSNQTLWMWLTMRADWEDNDNDTRFWFYCMYWIFGSLVYLAAHLHSRGWRALDFPQGRAPWLLLGLERRGGGVVGVGGKWEDERRWKFLINKKEKFQKY